MKETKGDIINKAITIVLVIALTLVPLVTIRGLPTELPRTIILLACGMGLLILLPFKIKQIKPDKTDICIIIFAILAILSAAFSTKKIISLWGTKDRFEGIFVILTYVLIYFHAKYSFIKFKKFENILTIAYIAICVLAIMQYYVPASLKIPYLNGHVNGTFGNTNFMGSFISLLLPAFMFKYITEHKVKYLIFSAMSFSVMIMCGARSSWVAFAMCLIGIGIYLIIKKDKTKAKKFGILILTFVICLIIIKITTFKNPWIASRFNLISNELNSFINDGISESMGAGRIRIWNMTIDVIKAKPLLGCGVDNLYFGLVECSTEKILDYISTHKNYVDKAHNELLHITATMGIPALIAYLGFVGSIFTNNIKKCLKNDTNMFFILIIGSYLVQAMFNISVIGIAPIFWFILGMSYRNVRENK